MRCCRRTTVAPWYILAHACEYNAPVPSECQSAIRPDLWVCVDAVIVSTGQTIRNTYAPLTARTFTFLHQGWCYTATYGPLDDSGLTATEADAIASGLERIVCGDVVDRVATDCADDRCPTGIGFVRATPCGGDRPDLPAVYVCAASVRREFVARITNGGETLCYCIKPGPKTDLTLIPPGSLIFYSVFYPEDGGTSNAPVVAQYRACCECSDGCVSAPLRGDPRRVCCCGDAVLLSYAITWSVRRTQTNGDWQEVTGVGTAGSPDDQGCLPVRYTFTTFRASDGAFGGNPPQDAAICPPNWSCGFPFPFGFPGGTGGPWPPPAWCWGGKPSQCGIDTTPPTFSLQDLLGLPWLEPVLPVNLENQQGRMNGVANASCNSIAMEQITTPTGIINGETGDVFTARINVNLTYAVSIPVPCRGECLGETYAAAKSTSARAKGCSGCGKKPPAPVPESVADYGKSVLG